jgi:hypothetical protein
MIDRSKAETKSGDGESKHTNHLRRKKNKQTNKTAGKNLATRFMRWKEGKKTTSATLALKALLMKVPAREMGVLVLGFFSSAIATVQPLLHTTDDENGRRGERKGEKERHGDRERERKKIRGKMNRTQTTIFYIQFFFRVATLLMKLLAVLFRLSSQATCQ